MHCFLLFQIHERADWMGGAGTGGEGTGFDIYITILQQLAIIMAEKQFYIASYDAFLS